MLIRVFLLFTFLSISCLPFPVYGIDSPDESLPNLQQEQRAERIGSQLRCLVCQNESIEDSSANLARDLRRIVRQHVKAGESDQQIMHWMVSRYGNFIRLSPPFTFTTALLWLMPFLAIMTGCLMAIMTFKNQRKNRAVLPLSDSEQKRLQLLMKDS